MAFCMMRRPQFPPYLEVILQAHNQKRHLRTRTAFRVSSRFERSAGTASAAPGTSLGFRLTTRIGSLRALSSLTSSLPIAPPAPKMVTTHRLRTCLPRTATSWIAGAKHACQFKASPFCTNRQRHYRPPQAPHSIPIKDTLHA
jgi:hypothetical protein